MSSLIHTMTMGAPTFRRLRTTAATLSYLLALGGGFALTLTGPASSLQLAGVMLAGVASALLWRARIEHRARRAAGSEGDGCWQAMMDGSPDAIMLLAPRHDLMGRFQGWDIRRANARAHAVFGGPVLQGRDLMDVLPFAEHASLYQGLDTARQTRQPQQDDHSLAAPDQDAPPRRQHQLMPCRDGIVLVTRDTTRAHADTLRDTTEKLRLASRVIEESGEAIVVSDALDRIEMVNPTFLHMTGMSPSEVLGKSAELLGLPPLRDSHLPGVIEALRDGQRWSGESRQVCADGRTLDTWLSVSTLRNEQRRVTQHIRVFSDISSLKAQQRELVEQARHDSLTGLPNRRAFGERLNQAMARARRNPQTLAVLFVDLDGFKAVNDQLGHAAGDQVLQEVARRLLDAVRLTDCVCRLAGDEFTVILEGAGHAGEVRRICQRILDRLSQPHDLYGQDWSVTPSIGAAVYEAGESPDQVCARADAAMYTAKRAGKARFVLSIPDRAESVLAVAACQGMG